ncbi:hypothetical protein B0T21DRAFT_411174 [Apiosordaria backusii]|uniref:Uncharacterized protein n=1 Tax=Apiosordaria backusii TaxID=314023 RepID=A0AA40EEZ7_9PEZI|nr:hypothetical protein B0T21DRAFT_411174 [Apiosordaria backusii]
MGLAYCIELDAYCSTEEAEASKAIKEMGKKLFVPAYGGSWAVFSQRPIPDEIVRYCAQDAGVLPILWREYDDRLSRRCDGQRLRERIAREEVYRVRVSQTEEFGRWKRGEMTLPPQGEEWREEWVHDGCCENW